jgi:hypothetical protein
VKESCFKGLCWLLLLLLLLATRHHPIYPTLSMCKLD